MSDTHEFLERDADLLANLNPAQRHAVIATTSSHMIEGFNPTRAQIAAAVAYVRGEIDGDTLVTRLIEHAGTDPRLSVER